MVKRLRKVAFDVEAVGFADAGDECRVTAGNRANTIVDGLDHNGRAGFTGSSPQVASMDGW
jgi:hypothetical protein